MIIEHNREKLINSIIYFLKNTKQPGKTKLFKLLYFADFMHFKETGKSITGMEYEAWDYGPVPDDLFHELKNPSSDLNESIVMLPNLSDKSFFEMKPKKKFDDKYFTKRELRILEQVACIFKEAKAEDMTDISHLEGMPWEKTIETKGKGHKIDYLLALDNTEKSLSKDEVLERIKEKEEFKRAFI